MIAEIISFLDGKYEDVIKELENQMQVASEELNFEKAAQLRDQILSIKRIRKKRRRSFSTSILCSRRQSSRQRTFSIGRGG